VLAALLPWTVVWAANATLPVPKWINLALGLFLLTALAGVWAAYNREAAWDKFWLLASGVLLYYGLTYLTSADLWVVFGSLVLLGDLIALFFLLGGSSPVHTNQNIIGGLIALLQPFSLALGWQAWKEHRRGLVVLVLISGILCLSCLIVIDAFGAWLALGAGLCTWFLWEAGGILESRLGLPKLLLFGVGSLAGILVIGLLVPAISSEFASLSSSLPPTASLNTRPQLYRDALELIPDFLFTGGGLASFPGLYSQYILGIPYFVYGYSHNLYLDLVLEQGLPGLLAALTVYIGSFWLLIKSLKRLGSGNVRLDRLSWAILAALIVVVVHGLSDDPLFGQSGTSLLFLVPGLAVTAARPVQSAAQVRGLPGAQPRPSPSRVWISLLMGAFILALGLVFYRPALAAWYADLGSVEMARVELAGWPTGAWESSSVASQLEAAEGHLMRSLSIDPANVTARYRLGMIAMLQRRYNVALAHLEAAYRMAPHHRGIQKQLGFSTLWSGQIDEGLKLLDPIPGLKGELDAYAWWWHTQGRDDLATIAQEASARLHERDDSQP
jgi:O-antigen ligase